MRIGLDAKWFFSGPPSGRLVVRSLVRELLALDTPHEWIVFLDSAAKETFPYERPGVEVARIWAGNNMLANVTSLPKEAERRGADVVLYQNFASPWGRAKRVAMIHDAVFLSHPRYYTAVERLYFASMKPLARRATRLCTVSHAERQRLVQHGFGAAERIDVVYHGVNQEFRPSNRQPPGWPAAVAKRYGLPERFVLFVGRLNVRKNLPGLLAALGRMQDNQIACVVVGAPDWKTDSSREIVHALGLSGRVHFLGAVPTGELAALYGLATVFCFPSFDEGFGLPALEAMASGTPVVASDIPSLHEVCGSAARFAHPEDPASIAREIERVLCDETLRKEMIRRGLARAAEFTWSRSATTMLECLSRAVA